MRDEKKVKDGWAMLEGIDPVLSTANHILCRFLPLTELLKKKLSFRLSPSFQDQETGDDTKG
ncbi:MAG TPA: hypothetical protein VMV49_08590 [Candidatus Deferrimicrobium sp.]|nr:hypothetical protein [Candidatus Deferrimicrobium sp.]